MPRILESAPRAASCSRVLEKKSDAVIRPYLALSSFSGSVLIARKGKVLLAKGYGMADYELSVPNSVATKFHLASVEPRSTL